MNRAKSGEQSSYLPFKDNFRKKDEGYGKLMGDYVYKRGINGKKTYKL